MKTRHILSTSILSLLALASNSPGINWEGDVSTDWLDPNNWAGGVVPAGQDAYIGTIGDGVTTFTATISANAPQVVDIQVARGGGPAILNHTAGSIATGGGNWLDVGTDGGTGTYNVADVNTTGGTLTGFGLGSGSVTANRIYIGGTGYNSNGGTGVVNVNTSGSVTVNNQMFVGRENGTGTLRLDAGTISVVNDIFVGQNSGTGTVSMSGGTFNRTGGWTVFGHNNGGNGTFNMSGGSVTTNPGETVVGLAGNAQGFFNLSGGTYTAGGEMHVGREGASTGAVTISGGTLNVATWFTLGRAGATGTLTMSGGTLNQGTNTSDSLFEMTNFNQGGSGTVNLNGGTLMVNGVVHNGGGGGTSSFNFNGGVLKARRDNTTFFQGLTTATVQAGGARFDSNGFNINVNQQLNEDAAGHGLTKLGNGTLTLGNTANGYSGATTLSGGTLSVSALADGGSTSTIGSSSNAAANLVFDGGALRYTGGTMMIDRSFTVNAGKTAVFDVSNAATVLTLNGAAPVTTGAAGLTKIGNGTLDLAFSSGSMPLPVAVNAGVLAADGTYAGGITVNNTGHLTAKNLAVGTLTTPTLTLGAGSALDFEFNGVTNDVLAVTGAGGLTLGTTGLYLYSEGSNAPFTLDGTYTIIQHNNGTIPAATLLSSFTIANSQVGKVYSLNGDTANVITLQIDTAVTTEWQLNGDGAWATDANWTAAHPDGLGTVATFGAIPTAPTVAVTVVGTQTVGSLVLDNPVTTYTISGGAGDVITFNNGFGVPSITQINGNHTINAPLNFFVGTNLTPSVGTTLTLGGVVSGNGLTVNGLGVVNLTATNTYSTTTVASGQLNIGAGGTSGTLGVGAVTINPGATLAFNRSDAITVGNNISGGGVLAAIGTGAVNFTGTAVHTGATNLNAGSGNFTNSGTINGTSGINVQSTMILPTGSVTTTPGTFAVFGGGTLIQTGGTNTSQIFTLAGPSNGTATISGGTLTSAQFYVGMNGGATGVVTMSGGTLNTNQWTVLGDNGGSSGTFNMSGGTWNQNHTDVLSIGQNGTGAFHMSGTAVLNDAGAVDTSDRSTNKGNVTVGRWGTGLGDWTLVGNAVANIRRLTVGLDGGSNGEVTIGGNAVVVASEDFHFGETGTGVVTIADGGSLSTATGWTLLGRNPGGDGTLNMEGGTMSTREILLGGAPFNNGNGGVGKINVTGGTLNGSQRVGLGEIAGQGYLNASGGTINFTNQLDVGSNSLGVLNLSGSAVMNVTNRVFIGAYNSGQGYVHQTGGTLTGNGGGDTRIGGAEANGVGAFGSYTLSGGSFTNSLNFQIGAYGTGILQVSGTGTFTTTAGFPVVGRYSGGYGVLDVATGGTFNDNSNNRLIVGEEGTGILNVRGGTVIQSSGNAASGVSIGHTPTGNGMVNLLAAGVLSAPSVGTSNASATSVLNFHGGTLQARIDTTTFLEGLDAAYVYAGGGIIDTQAQTVTILQDLLAPTGSGVTSIPVLGGGTGYLSAPVVKITDGGGTGATAVATINGLGELTGIIITNPGVNYTSAPTVTLVGGNPTAAATLDAGTLAANATGTLTKTGTGTLNLDGLQGYSTLTTSDGVTNVNTSFTGGTATVNANATTNFGASQTLAALNIGAGAVVTLNATPPFAPLSAAGSAVVPEPGSIGLLLVGALGLLARRRRPLESRL